QNVRMTNIVRQPAPPPPGPPARLTYAGVCMAQHESNTLIIKSKDDKSNDDIQKVLKKTLKDIKIDRMRTTTKGTVVLNLPDPTS
ncbi:MAG: hypothetical protein AAGJ80_01795, partial [Cyanobacteria bacterium J06553_1]